VGFLLLSVILNTHISTFVRSRTGDANRSASTRRWRSIHGRRRRSRDHRSRHSPLARDRASGVRFATTEPVRFGSFFCFLRRVRFCDGPTDGRSARSIEEGFKTRIVDQFILGFVLATDRFDPIRSDPTRSFASGSLRALSNRDARGFHLDEVNKNLRDAVPSARLGVAGVVDVDVRASERSVARAIRFRSPTRSALARESSAGGRGRGRVARRFVRSPGSTASATVRSVRSFARRSRRSFAGRHPSHPSIRREGRSASHGT